MNAVAKNVTNQILQRLYYLNFILDRVNFKISQLAKDDRNIDEDIFSFVLDGMKMETTLRTFDLVGEFDIGKTILVNKENQMRSPDLEFRLKIKFLI